MVETREGQRPRRRRGAASAPSAPRPRASRPDTRPWWQNPLVRIGAYTWALLGIVGAAALLTMTAGRLSIIVLPLVLALFPAALLSPFSEWLIRQRVPAGLAALVTIVGFLVVLVGGTSLLAPQIAAEMPGLVEEVEDGIEQLQDLIDEGIFGWEPPAEPTELLALAQEQGVQFLQREGVTIATTLAEGIVGLLFALVALFFYLKDGRRIAAWIRSLAPRTVATEVRGIGEAAWTTIGQYFRGQLFVALVDAVFIGIGLAILGVPLVLPLAVLVFFGGLFPIVGAFISGTVAVLVALAAEGIGIALATLAIVVVVQQVESNVLAPVVLGRATALHPLGVIVALSAGGILMGVVGAFLAVPVAASVTKAVGVVRSRHT